MSATKTTAARTFALAQRGMRWACKGQDAGDVDGALDRWDRWEKRWLLSGRDEQALFDAWQQTFDTAWAKRRRCPLSKLLVAAFDDCDLVCELG